LVSETAIPDFSSNDTKRLVFEQLIFGVAFFEDRSYFESSLFVSPVDSII